jgi:hypothetical protein
MVVGTGLTLLSVRGVETLCILRSEASTRAMSNTVRYGRLIDTRKLNTKAAVNMIRAGMRKLAIADDEERIRSKTSAVNGSKNPVRCSSWKGPGQDHPLQLFVPLGWACLCFGPFSDAAIRFTRIRMNP